MEKIQTKKFVPLSIYLIAIFLLLFLAPPAVFAQDEETGTGEWLTFRGNPEHTGKSDLEGPPEEVELKWRWRVNYESAPITASPAVMADGMVYIGTEGSYIGAVKPEGGSGWIYKVSGPVVSSPAVGSDGSVLVVSNDGYIYYIDGNGELLWKSDFDVGIASSPVISGGLAYLGTDDSQLLALKLSPDLSGSFSESNKILTSEVKEFSFSTKGKVRSSPAFSGNTVFFGGGSFFYAINPTAGQSGDGGGGEATALQQQNELLKWQYDVHADILSSPAVTSGKVFIGADDGYLYAFSENVSNDEQKGELIWKKKTGGKIQSSPAIGERDGITMVYIGSDDGKLYAFDEDGEIKWTFKTFGPIRSSAAVDKNGDIYFGSDDGSIYALFPDGSLKWRFQTLGAVRSSPAIGPNKRLYVGSNDGYLYCLGESDEEEREPDIQISISTTLSSIENDGNPTTITASITSETEGSNILSRVATVTIDLTTLHLEGVDPDNPEGDLIEITKEPMLDDGENEDDVAGDGNFVYAFGITTDATSAALEAGIFTHFLTEGSPPVGPVPIMVTVEDIYGHQISKPFALNIIRKERGSLSQGDIHQSTISNRLSNQTLNLSFTSGTPSILSISPNQGSPGQRITIAITGRNTNFTKNKTRVEIFNEEDFLIASALPENDDVEVQSNTILAAFLNILNTDQVQEGGLIGKWDVTVTTTFTAGSEEIVVAEDAFEISSSSASILSPPSNADVYSLTDTPTTNPMQQQCVFTLDIVNEAGAHPNGAPWLINSGNEREITIERADSGEWNYIISLGTCSAGQSFKITTEGSNFGFLQGEVRNAITGDGIDGATIVALTGEISTEDANTATSSGGGYYMLPLSATQDKYTVIAQWNGWIDIENEVVINEDEETQLNFSLRPEIPCPITSLMEGGSKSFFSNFRDSVLLKIPEGRLWVRLYYRHAREVQQLMEQHPLLRQKSRAFLQEVLFAASNMRKNGNSPGDIMNTHLEELIDNLVALGSPELKKSLKQQKKAILNYMKTGCIF